MTGFSRKKASPHTFSLSHSQGHHHHHQGLLSLSACAILRPVVVYGTDDNMFPALWSFARSSMLGGTVRALMPSAVV